MSTHSVWNRPLPFLQPAGDVADDNDRFVEPEPRPAPPPPPPAERRQHSRCVIIGPSGVGKTTLLRAFERACELSRRGEPDLTFIADPAMARAGAMAVWGIKERAAAASATRERESYSFHIWTRSARPRSLAFEKPLDIEISDGPGGALFPAELENAGASERHRRWRAHMLEAVREADSLILCVDLAKPQTHIWQLYLNELIAHAARRERVPVDETRVDRLTRWIRRRPPRVAEIPVLKATRILVLLMKVDRLGEKACRAFESSTNAGQSTDDFELIKPDQLARSIEPVWQAREVLGVSSLNLLRFAMNAKQSALAVGVCSAGGFAEDGYAFWLESGTPRGYESDSASENIKAWDPYGIRDALFFIGSKRPVTRGTIRVVERDDMIVPRDRHWIGRFG
jgi:energy-coupling factor transporter ATP-binding protein EcfA2